MSDSDEVNHLKELIREAYPTTTHEVRKIVEDYFATVKWSVLKDEYRHKMTQLQREQLYTKLLLEAVNSITSRMKVLNIDSIEPD